MRDIVVSEDLIQGKILYIRGRKVLMDRDLAVLYGVENKVLNQAVKRNLDRFPDDFMFQLSKEEMKTWKPYIDDHENGNDKPKNLKSHFVTSSLGVNEPKSPISRHGGIRKRPYAFTEQGVAMLSSVLKS